MRFHTVILLLVLLGLLLVPTALQTYAQLPEDSSFPAENQTITLTSSGFSPAVITVSLGTTISWQNATSQTYTLTASPAYSIFLPLLMKTTSGAQASRPSAIAPANAFSSQFAAGATFTYQMTSAGELIYSLNEAPHLSGRVIIVSATQPTSTSVRTEIPSQTTSPTMMPTSTGTTEPTMMPTSTGTTEPTMMPTSTGTTEPTMMPTSTGTTEPTMMPTSTGTTEPTMMPTSTGTTELTATPTATATDQPTATPTATATDGPTATPTNTTVPTPTPSPTATAPSLMSIWMLNTTNETSAYLRSSGNPIAVNVQSVAQGTLGDGSSVIKVSASGIPNYTYTMTDADIQALNSRPQANSDFVNGYTTASTGQTIAFGQDIGFRSQAAGSQCPSGQGYGYWPPGPSCPTQQTKISNFPMNPSPAANPSAVGGSSGLWINGTAIFNWGDNMTYNNQGVWQNLAMKFEVYDMDICTGHAPPNGTYHHHGYPNCLGKQLGDDGTAHSPVYGVAYDGYMVYGPWYADGVLAEGGWKTRDYSAGSATGCGADYKRTCLLVDEYDYTKGTTTASSAGPDTNATVTSLSHNEFVVTSGYYYQDYYYDSSCSGAQCLDSNSGHSHDNLGYHYHVPMVQNNDGLLTNVFPFTFGPRYYGTAISKPPVTSQFWNGLLQMFSLGSSNHSHSGHSHHGHAHSHP